MKIKYVITSLLVALFFTTAGCKKEEEATETTKPAFDLAAAKTQVEAGYKEFETAFNAKDSVGLANCYTSDAKLMGPNNKSVEGKDNIQKMFGESFKGETPSIKLSLVEVWGNETNLVAENKWEMAGKDGKVLDTGKSIEVYKMVDGKWRMIRDCYNSDMPPAK